MRSVGVGEIGFDRVLVPERRLISGRVREDEIIQPVTAETVPRPRYTSEKINSPALLRCP